VHLGGLLLSLGPLQGGFIGAKGIVAVLPAAYSGAVAAINEALKQVVVRAEGCEVARLGQVYSKSIPLLLVTGFIASEVLLTC
jgi:hypothetical protein